MSSHTPGPWAIETDHDDDIEDTVLIHGAADAPGLVPVALVYTADAFPCVDDEDRADFESECNANARLIAAAPDLLKELETAIAWIADMSGPYAPTRDEILPQLRATIAKAHGETPPPAPEPRKGEYLIPAGARAASCRSCGADVLWITTAKGSAMPLSVATIEERGGERHALSHFSDCPQGKGWSKKGK